MVLPLKDQISADMVKEQLKDLSLKVNTTIQPVFASWKIEQELNVKEAKPLIVNEQCVVMQGYEGYTCRRLHNHEKGHKQQCSSWLHCQTLQERAQGYPSGPAEMFQSS